MSFNNIIASRSHVAVQHENSRRCPLCGVSGEVNVQGTDGVLKNHSSQDETRFELFYQGKQRPYLRCPNCCLVFVPGEYYLSAAQERAEYELHENAAGDAGYRRFLCRLCDPLSERLTRSAKGLDFGCGPGPALDSIMRERGFQMSLYDPLFANDNKVWNSEYDFITASEVIEHVAEPLMILQRLLDHLRPGGYLGLMTKLVINKERFAGWHYKNDMTHIAFYSRETFAWIAARFALRLEIIGTDVILLQKNPHLPL